MQRLSVIWLLFLLSWGSLFAQAANPKDSLRTLIDVLAEDTAKLDVYFRYGFLMEDENLDSAGYFYRKANDISREYGHVTGQIRFVHNYSYVLNLQGKLDEANLLNREGLRLAREHRLELDVAKALVNLANNFNHKGQYDSAMAYYLEAAVFFEKLKLPSYLGILYQNIGIVFDATEQFNRSIEYGRKSLGYFQSNSDSAGMASVLINLGSSLASLDELDSALMMFGNARLISSRINFASGLHAAFIGIGNAYRRKKNERQAMEAFNESLVVARRTKYPGGIANALNGLAMVMVDQGRFAEANDYAMEAIGISEQAESGVFTDLRQQYKLLADIKGRLNQTEQAYHYLKEYVRLNDSLSGADIQRLTAGLERKYQFAQKEEELAQQQLQLEQIENHVRRKNTLLLIVVGGLFLLAVIVVLLYRYFSQRQRLQQQEFASLQQQQEVIRLRSTLEGQQQERMRIAKEMHDDIGSGLTSLVFLANSLPEDSDAGRREKIADTARQMVSQMNEIVWSLNSEQDTLEDFVIYSRHSISEMLDTMNMEYEFRVPSVIPPCHLSGAERRHLFLVLKEAVHNSIKHSGATCITVSMEFTDAIRIAIADNGKGISGEGSPGNGLKNMQFRMKEIGGEWKLATTRPVKIALTLPMTLAV